MQDPNDAVCSPEVSLAVPFVHEARIWHRHALMPHPPCSVLPFTDDVLDKSLQLTFRRVTGKSSSGIL